MKFDSKLVHAGYDPLEDPNLSISPPIHRTTAYQFKNTEHAANLFGLKEFGNIYSRLGNPTVAVLEKQTYCNRRWFLQHYVYLQEHLQLCIQ